MSAPEQYHALRHRAALVDRSARGRLRLAGRDRRAYLQGLLTNDIAALGPGEGCYAAYLTPQGRMIADMRVFELGDAILVDLEGPVTDAVRDRWEMFIFSEDVQIADRSVDTVELGVYGPAAADALSTVLAQAHAADEPAPSADQLEAMSVFSNARWDFRGEPAIVLRSDDPGVHGFDLVVAARHREALEALFLAAGVPAAGPEVVEVTRVEAGRPRFGVDMDAETIPLEAGIEARAISLTKGCYVGQEIIIRVLHRGHGRVARRLVGLTFEPGAEVPQAGDGVRSDGREIGAVTSAVRSPGLERPIALAYVHRDFVEPGTPVVVTGTSERAARVAALPFIATRPSVGG